MNPLQKATLGSEVLKNMIAKIPPQYRVDLTQPRADALESGERPTLAALESRQAIRTVVDDLSKVA